MTQAQQNLLVGARESLSAAKSWLTTSTSFLLPPRPHALLSDISGPPPQESSNRDGRALRGP
jgi:hypothetical protein